MSGDIETPSDRLPRYYSNVVSLAGSPHDVTATFIQVDGTDLPAEIEGPHGFRGMAQCQIIMSPQHAKAFLRVLDDTIKQYEEAYGAIPGPVVPQS